jgi:hypothetical protein
MEPEDKVSKDTNKTNSTTPKQKVVKTFMDDMTYALADGKDGIIKKIIHSEEQHEIEKRNLSPQSKKNKLLLFFGLLLLLVSAGLLVFFFQKREAPTVEVAKQFESIIFTDKNVLVELVDLKKNDIHKKVAEEVNKNTVKPREILGIYPTLNNAPISLQKFIGTIEGNFTPTAENFVDDNFLMGAVKNDNKSSSFFILVKTRSIADIFGAMRTWEPKMFLDLHGFFGIELSPETKDLLTKEFANGIIENKNARILYDADNKIVMAYIYANDNSVVVTNSENAVREIMFRLASSEIKK